MIARLAALIETFTKPAAIEPRPRAPRRLRVVREALLAIAEGRWEDAEDAITMGGATVPRDAALINLLGVVSQGRSRWKEAKHHFGRAMRTDASYAPAEQNMRRLYELETFGRTKLPIVLVDEAIAREVEPRVQMLVMRQ